MEPKVLVVLNPFTRPHNAKAQVEAFKNQTVRPWKIIAIDNKPHGSVEIQGAGADKTWVIADNLGLVCKFIPAYYTEGHDYVYFADDDLIPGREAIENCLEQAQQLNNNFSTFGQVGRVFDGLEYRAKNAPKGKKVDITCRTHFFQSNAMIHAMDFQLRVAEINRSLARVHDDMILSMGLQKGTGYPSYCIDGHIEKSMMIRDFPDREGVWQRPNHFNERNQMIKLAHTIGWRSLVS